MDFDYSEEQRYLREEARRFLATAAPPAVARAVLDDPARGYDAALWGKIAAQGWLGTALPERFGGLGLGKVELAAITETIGGAIAPVPFGSSIFLFADALLLTGSDEQRAARLPAIADGSAIGCAALFEGGDLNVEAVDAAVRDERLTGRKQPVVDGGVATHAVVLARDTKGVGLFLVALDDGGVTRHALEAMDGSRDVAALAFDGAAAARLPGSDAGTVTDLLARAAVLTAFEQIGGAERCLQLALAYVKERQAFGGPVGRFQAVKHKLADIYVAIELARSHAFHGVWAIEAGSERLLQAAAAARVAASDAYWLASKECVHLHGAIGFTWEADPQLYYRRAHHLSLALGSPQWWRDRLVETLRARPVAAPAAMTDEDAVALGPLSPETV